MTKQITKSAVVIVDNPILLPNIFNYLFKFNFNKIILLKKTNLNLDLNFYKDKQFKFIIKNYNNKNFLYNYIKKKSILNNLENNFLVLKSSKFIDVNLFKLFKLFKKNKKKLIITVSKKNKGLNNSECFFLRKKLINSYDFSFKEILKNKNYLINIVNDDFIYINKKTSKKKIINFFSKINSKAIILDRDGVINVNKGYVGFKKDFVFQKGAIKALKFLNDNKYNIYVVTNQSGIARGYFSEKDVINLHNFIIYQLEIRGIYINKFYYSPYHKDGIVTKYKKNSSCRKPGIKLFKILVKEWNIINKKNITMIGDQKSDMEFAINAKIKFALFLNGNLFNFIKTLVSKKKF